MKMVRCCVVGLCFVLAFASLKGCSSSEAPTLNSVSDLPSFDVSNYDYSMATEGLLRLSTHAIEESPVGKFSRAACEGYTLKRQLFQDAKSVDSFLCYIKTLEAKAEGMTVPEEAYAYYEINFPEKGEGEEEGPPANVRVRVGKFGTQLRMDACIPQGETYRREVEVRIGVNATGYEGYVVNEYSFSDGDKSKTGNSKIEVAIVGKSATDFTSAQFDAYHKDQDGSGEESWQSKMSFTADDTSKANTLSGINQFTSNEWGDNQGQIYGMWEAAKGSVKFQVMGQHHAPTAEQCSAWGTPDEYLPYCVDKCWDEETNQPKAAVDGMCEFTHSGTESFDIDMSKKPPQFTTIDNSASSFYETVLAASLSDLEGIDEEVAFVEDWDCASSAGFTTVDATAISELRNCEEAREDDLWRMCEEQDRGSKSGD